MFALWHAKTRIACMRSPNLWCHFVGNAHLLLHAHFHCNPLLPASRNVSLGVLCAQLRALCARHPNTNDVILLVTPISSFMLIFIAILRFQPSEIANLCFLVCSAHNYAYCVRVIPKPMMSFCWQRPSPPSCQFSSQSFASSLQKSRIYVFSKTYDAILSTTSIFSFMPIFFPILHFKPLEIADTCIFAGCMRYNARWVGAITNSLFWIVGPIAAVADTDFRANRPLLATTFWGQTANSCKPPTKLYQFYYGPYGPKLKF